jgi:hypothetical protein
MTTTNSALKAEIRLIGTRAEQKELLCQALVGTARFVELAARLCEGGMNLEHRSRHTRTVLLRFIVRSV